MNSVAVILFAVLAIANAGHLAGPTLLAAPVQVVRTIPVVHAPAPVQVVRTIPVVHAPSPVVVRTVPAPVVFSAPVVKTIVPSAVSTSHVYRAPALRAVAVPVVHHKVHASPVLIH